MGLINNITNISITKQRQLQRAAWARTSQHMLDLLEGNTAGMRFVEEFLGTIYKDGITRNEIQNYWPHINVMDQIVSARSKVYGKRPDRLLVNSQGQAIENGSSLISTYSQLSRDSKLDKTMKRAERYNECIGSCVLYASPNFDAKRFRWQVLPSAELIIDQCDSDPADFKSANSIAVPIGGNPDSTLSRPNQVRYAMYYRDDGRIRFVVTDEELESINPQPEWVIGYAEGLDEYPFILVQTEDPQEGDGVFRDVRWPLMAAQLFACWFWAAQFIRYKYKGWEPYVIGEERKSFEKDNGSSVTMHPSVAMFTEADISNLEWTPNAEQYKAFEEQFRSAVGNSLGIGQALVPTEAATSGVALYYRRLPESEYRDSVSPIYQDIEREVHKLSLMMANLVKYNGAASLKGTDVSVTYPVAVPMSPLERRQSQQLEIQMGLTSPSQILQEERGIDVEEAASIVEENEVKNTPGQPTNTAQ